MCSESRREGLAHRLGNIVQIYFQTRPELAEARWTGYAQESKLAWWLQASQGIKGFMLADSFTEQGKEFRVETGKIQAIFINKPVILSENKTIAAPGEIKIITRAAVSDFERRIHSRWPIVELEKNKYQEFSSAYLINKSINHQLSLYD